MIQLKRVYAAPSATGGMRVLVDRLWPCGLTKDRAAVDLWLKDLAPSTNLRKRFADDSAKWKQFQERCRRELRAGNDAIGLLKAKGKQGAGPARINR